ncbi:TPA: hypothetical protein HA244_04850 [Candidatus Micrarchaeota archaeon]|nr:hypothetical protein [Candidatus Micrarchaeota archaeon]
MKKTRMRGVLLSIDALFALTIMIILALSINAFSQHQETRLIQLHQMGRDYLVVNYKNHVPFLPDEFIQLTHYNATLNPNTILSSSITAYPELCNPSTGGVPKCLSGQDYVTGDEVDFNAMVSP